VLGFVTRRNKTIEEDEQFSLDLTGSDNTTGCDRGLSLKQQDYFPALKSPRGTGYSVSERGTCDREVHV